MSCRQVACLALLALSCSAGKEAPTGPGPADPPAFGRPELLWDRGGCATSGCGTGWYASPALVDLDGDGAAEIVWGGGDLVALDGSGALRWRAAGAGRIWPSPAVADLDGDGDVEIAVARAGNALTVYDASGATVWSLAPLAEGELRTLAVADLDGDGTREVVAGSAARQATEQLVAIRHDGVVLPGWPARRTGEPGYGWGLFNENVAIADLDGDGDQELVNPTDTHYVTALDHAGSQLPASPRYGAGKVWSQVGVHVDDAVDLRGWAECGVEHRPNFADSAPAVGDLDGDGTPEIVIVGNVYDCSGYRSLHHAPFVLRADRSRWATGEADWTVLPAPPAGASPRSEDWTVIETAVPNAVLADLDGDGRREILFPSYDGRVHAYALDRTQRGSWPFDASWGGALRFASEPAVADLDGDGKAEVIVATWPPKGTSAVGQLHVLDHLGRALYSLDLPPSFPAGSWNGALGAPAIGNVDGNADVEIVLGTARGGVVAYRVPGSARAKVLWGTGRGSLERRGTPPAP
jgi:hypothetical protein